MKLFSEHIKSRYQRWWVHREPNQFRDLAGKLAGREFVENLGLKVPDLYHVSDTVEEIPEFSSLPNRFVIKPSRGYSSNNVFVMIDGKNQLDNQLWSRDAIIESIAAQPNVNQNKGTKIMIEEYLEDWKNPEMIPYDYKFFMFGGKCAFVAIIERNSKSDNKKNRFWNVTTDWQMCKYQIMQKQIPQIEMPDKPDSWKELCDTARILGEELGIFMRIDLYATTKGAVFGEFTPQPHGGNGYTEDADKWLGSIWKGLEGVN